MKPLAFSSDIVPVPAGKVLVTYAGTVNSSALCGAMQKNDPKTPLLLPLELPLLDPELPPELELPLEPDPPLELELLLELPPPAARNAAICITHQVDGFWVEPAL